MSKYLLRFGLLGTVIFLGLFLYFYKASGKFRKSIIAAIAALNVVFSGLTMAGATGEAHGFTTKPQQSTPSHRSGSLSGRASSDGSGPGKPDDFDSDGDDWPQFPKREPVEKTEERVKKIDDYFCEMSEVSDSETETESESESENELVKNNNISPVDRRNSPGEDDIYIEEEDLTLFGGQMRKKTKSHGNDFDLPYKFKPNGKPKTEPTPENVEAFGAAIVNLVKTGNRYEGTYRQGKSGGHNAIIFHNPKTNQIAIFHAEERRFVSAWKATQYQVEDLEKNQNIGASTKPFNKNGEL